VRKVAVRQYKRRREIGFACAAFGLMWQLAVHHPWAMSLPGAALVVYGCLQQARAKSWHPAWGALGLVPVLGLIAVAFLPNRTPVHYRIP
jgi:hypothetical protein